MADRHTDGLLDTVGGSDWEAEMIVNRQLVTKVLEEANKYCRDDSPSEDPMKQYGYETNDVRKAVEYCRQNGLIATRARFRKGYEDMGTDRWWKGGLTLRGMEELEGRQRDVKSFNREMMAERDSHIPTRERFLFDHRMP